MYSLPTGKKSQSKSKGSNLNENFAESEFQSLPVQSKQKEYEPKTFEDAHISDVVKENEDLKMKVRF